MTSLPLRLTSLQDEDPWVVHQKLFDTLNEYLQPLSTTSPSAAANEIDMLLPMKRAVSDEVKPNEEPASFMLEIWESFIDIARQIHSDHPSQDRLVDLIKSLQELPPTTIQIWGATTRAWADLPLLGPTMRESWHSPTYYDKTPEPQDAERWLNQNAFAARLLNLDKVSWNQFAVWSLRSALENRQKNLDILKCDVSVAAEWIKHCGPYIYEQVVGDVAREEWEKTNDKEGDSSMGAGQLYKGKGKPRLCLERWEFWKKRFGEIAETGRSDVKVVAEKAKERMESIESTSA